KNRNEPLMLALQVLGRNIESGKIHVVDKILRRHFREADGIRTAVPMEVHGTTTPHIEPFVQSAPECRPVTLMNFGQPDEDISVAEKPAQGRELFIGGIRDVFGENYCRNVGSRSPD